MALLDHTPTTTLDEARRICVEVFGVSGDVTELPSERDRNFRVDAGAEGMWVLKVANALESREVLEAQAETASRAAYGGVPVAGVRRSLAGDEITEVDGHLVRLMEHLPGVLLADVAPGSSALRRDLGATLGRLARSLDGFDHPQTHREFHWDVVRATEVIDETRHAVSDPQRLALLDHVHERMTSYVVPRLPALRTSVIHGDANDHNVLVESGDPRDPANRFTRVCGLIDFGDLVHSVVVAEVAVAAAYHALATDDPIGALCDITAGFHAEHALTEGDLEVLWDLMLARLALSGAHAAVQSAQRPDDPYLFLDEGSAWQALTLLTPIPPERALYRLRDACGYEPHRSAVAVRAHLGRSTPAPLLGTPWDQRRLFALDLSVGSDLFRSADVGAGPDVFDRIIRRDVDGDPDAVAIGGYGEARLLYTAPEFASSDDPSVERRTVHLGTDVWTHAGTALHAPLPGRVHRIHDNSASLDYGPMVILEHATDEGVAFWSLYGHLSPEALTHLREGDDVAAGDLIGWIGSAPRNGDWAPHVHVQLILDLLGLDVDYPGVAVPSQRSTWLGLSPDPALLLGLSSALTAATVPRSIDDTLSERRRLLGPNLSVSYSDPLRIVRGIGAHLYDDEGRGYLDSVNNVAHVGHAHPHVVAAGARQMSVLNTNTRYLHDEVLRYAERLTATLPDPLSVCFFVNSGSEANDLALRLVRAHTGAWDLICVEHGYHGHTQALIDVSPYKHAGAGGRGAPPWVHVARMPDPYRGEFRGYGPEVGVQYAADVARCAREVEGGQLAGMIVESMIGCGGQVVLPDGYLVAAAEHVHEAGGLVIADEVQVGFGRVGPAFWGCATQGLVPDVVTIGKPAGDGHPLAAVVTTPEIAASFANGMEYFNTFGGNPVSAAIGNAVLDVIEQEQLPVNAERLGRRILDGMRAIADEHALIGEARGLGLYLGVELVRDRETLEPAGAEASWVIERMRQLGVLVSTDGPFHNVLKIKPPLVWTDADADRLLETLDRVLREPALRR